MWRYYNLTIQNQKSDSYGRSQALNRNIPLLVHERTIFPLVSTVFLNGIQPLLGWVTSSMRGSAAGRKTCFLQHRCTRWQHYSTIHRSEPCCVYFFLFHFCAHWRLWTSHTFHFLQGWYNLGLLAEEGYRLPLSILIELGLSELYMADRNLLISHLYKRWVEK